MNAITPTALEAVGIIDATNRSSRFPATEKRPPLIPHDAKDDKPMTKMRIFVVSVIGLKSSASWGMRG